MIKHIYKVTLISIFLLIFPGKAIFAWSNVTGESLLDTCKTAIEVHSKIGNSLLTQDENGKYNACLSYITGVDDAHETMAAIHAGIPEKYDDVIKKFVYCRPDGVTRIQEARIVVKYLESHPEILHFKLSAIVVIAALRQAYPCKKQ